MPGVEIPASLLIDPGMSARGNVSQNAQDCSWPTIKPAPSQIVADRSPGYAAARALDLRIGIAATEEAGMDRTGPARNGTHYLPSASRKHTSQVIHLARFTAAPRIQIQREVLRGAAFLPRSRKMPQAP